MPLFEKITLKESTAIKTTPGEIFDFFMHLDSNYREWHPEDHVLFYWVEGRPWEVGSISYAEEYLHGKLRKLKSRVTRIVPNRYIEYAPTSRLLRYYFPMGTFTIEPKGDTSIFTATVSMRVGWIVKALFRDKFENGLSSVRKHMKEEGENLKNILESQQPAGTHQRAGLNHTIGENTY